MLCVKILQYFLPILLALTSGITVACYNRLVYSTMSVIFFLCVHYIVNIVHSNSNRFLFVGILMFIIFDIQRSAIVGVNLAPFCLASALFYYLTAKKYLSNKCITLIASIVYTIGSGCMNYFISNYLDIPLLIIELSLFAVIFIAMFLFYAKLSQNNEINYIK